MEEGGILCFSCMVQLESKPLPSTPFHIFYGHGKSLKCHYGSRAKARTEEKREKATTKKIGSAFNRTRQVELLHKSGTATNDLHECTRQHNPHLSAYDASVCGFFRVCAFAPLEFVRFCVRFTYVNSCCAAPT